MSSINTQWIRAAAMVAVVLGSVHIPRATMANGAALPAGTYEVRVTDEVPSTPVGQTPDAERWVEFVKKGNVVGRELATVILRGDMASVTKGAHPKTNGSLVQLLRGGEYLRIWINKGGNNYIVNLPVAGR